VLYNNKNYRKILHNFSQVEIEQNKNNEWHTEPAVIRHEIVHKAKTISELQLYNEAEHKGITPEFAAKLFFRIRIKTRNR